MKCNKCGNHIEDINDYCDKCGAKVVRKKWNPIKLVLILIMEFIFTLLFILFLIFIVKNSIKDLSSKKFTETLSKYNFKIEDITKQYEKETGLSKYLLAKNEKDDIYYHYVLLEKKQKEMFYAIKQKLRKSFENTFIETSITFHNYQYYSIEDNEKCSVVIRKDDAILWIGGDIKNKENIKKITSDLNIVYPNTIILLIILYLLLVFLVVKIVEWNIFVKARKKGWYVFIPIYRSYSIAKIAFGYGWNFIFKYIPLVNIIYIPILLYKISRSFGKSVFFSIINIIFPYINMQIIAFDHSKYTMYKKIEEENNNKKKKKKSDLSGELIIYNKKKKDEFSYITEDKVDTDKNINKQMYQNISKLQHRNSILICVAIFLYFLSLSLIVLFSDIEEDETILTTLPPLILILIATILLIISKVTKPKTGKIKYNYKNEVYLLISIILFGINAFILNDGLTFLMISYTLQIAIWIAELGVSISFLVYYFKSYGTKRKKLKKWIKVVLFILSISIGFLIAYPISEEVYTNSDIMFDYSKTSQLVYEQEDRAIAFYKSDKIWYTFTNQYNTEHFEFSASDKLENLNIVYETDNVRITSLTGNDDYAVWCEISNETIGYYFYDVSENQVYELLTIPYSSEMKQIPSIGVYKDNIYYEVIDYNEKQITVVECNITSSKNRVIYTIKDIIDTDLEKNSLNINGSNLVLTSFVNSTPTIINLDLGKPEKDSYKTHILILDDNISNIYKASIDNNRLILYYNKNGSDVIEIMDNKGNSIQQIYTFANKEYVYSNDIYFKDNMLYFIKLDQKIDINKMSNRTKLIIYNLDNKQKQEIKGIFDYCITKNKIYGLGTYKDNLENVRLYEIWN